MRIATVIDTCDHESLIAATIKSAMNGSRLADEQIVIGQSHREEKAQIVETFSNIDRRIQYVATQTRGLCLARNMGLAASTGEVIAFTDIELEFTKYPDLAKQSEILLSPTVTTWELMIDRTLSNNASSSKVSAL